MITVSPKACYRPLSRLTFDGTRLWSILPRGSDHTVISSLLSDRICQRQNPLGMIDMYTCHIPIPLYLISNVQDVQGVPVGG